MTSNLAFSSLLYSMDNRTALLYVPIFLALNLKLTHIVLMITDFCMLMYQIKRDSL